MRTPRDNRRTPRRGAVACAALALLALSAPAHAATVGETMDLCRNAARAAADRHAIPRAVMLAITTVETRTKREGAAGPWPWTVNVAGAGQWFDSRAAALLHAQAALAKGQKSFDVGCFQLNYRWHGANFASIDQMFEPATSADYAARFLKQLHADTGDWMKAAGHYHSRTPKHATRYRRAVGRAVARLGGVVPGAAKTPAPPTPRIIRVSAAAPSTKPATARIRAPIANPGGVTLVIVRRANGGLLRQSRRREGS